MAVGGNRISCFGRTGEGSWDESSGAAVQVRQMGRGRREAKLAPFHRRTVQFVATLYLEAPGPASPRLLPDASCGASLLNPLKVSSSAPSSWDSNRHLAMELRFTRVRGTVQRVVTDTRHWARVCTGMHMQARTHSPRKMDGAEMSSVASASCSPNGSPCKVHLSSNTGNLSSPFCRQRSKLKPAI